MIYPKTDKRRLYQLMFMFLNGQIDAKTFSDELYYQYDVGDMDKGTLDEMERKYFHLLDEVALLYAPETARAELPGFYKSEEDLTAKIHEVIKALGDRCDFPYSGNRPDNPVFIRKPRS